MASSCIMTNQSSQMKLNSKNKKTSSMSVQLLVKRFTSTVLVQHGMAHPSSSDLAANLHGKPIVKVYSMNTPIHTTLKMVSKHVLLYTI